ncbi:uncharacterized protein CDAR_13331 [Caerostris darwini]|uniref:Ionotropic glutamate receptor L-glutamate and glycine-binding domain-containing protein n=1 Tax=Caerostris darwini TaxID=1538125 RepID=A0AAV4R552_9ARAC|nr:uncharacterized protein CDAR_13331 [Caerostris darwini]
MKFPSFLRIAIVPKKGIFDVNISPNGSVTVESGSENEILELLSSALHFKYEILAPPDGDWGNFINGTWSGTIGMVYRGEADLAIGKIAITESRASVLDYSYPYDIEVLTFATKIPGLVQKFAAFIWPFSWGLWTGIFTILIFITIVSRFLLTQNYTYQQLALKVFGNLLHQQLGLKLPKCSDKMLVAGWMIGSMFISFSYTAVLLSFLTIPQRNKGIRYLDDLAEAVESGSYKCLTFAGDTHVEIFLRSQQPSVKNMGELILKNNWRIHALKNLVEKAMDNGRTAVVAPKFFFENIMANQVLISYDSLSAITRAIFFKKDFCCKKMIDNCIQKITAAGFYRRYLGNQLYKRNFDSDVASKISDSVKSLTVKDMSSAFLLLVLGYCLAFLTCIAEKFHFRKRNLKKRKMVLPLNAGNEKIFSKNLNFTKIKAKKVKTVFAEEMKKDS